MPESSQPSKQPLTSGHVDAYCGGAARGAGDGIHPFLPKTHHARGEAMTSAESGMARSTRILHIVIPDEVRGAVGRAFAEIPNPEHACDLASVIARKAFCLLPDAQLGLLLDFGRHVDMPGVALVENLPLDADLPPTPADGGPCQDKPGYVAEGVLMGLSGLLGEPVHHREGRTDRARHRPDPGRRRHPDESELCRDAQLPQRHRARRTRPLRHQQSRLPGTQLPARRPGRGGQDVLRGRARHPRRARAGGGADPALARVPAERAGRIHPAVRGPGDHGGRTARHPTGPGARSGP